MNVFKLFASLVLDSSKYDKGLKDAESNASKFASFIGKGMVGATTAMFSAAAAGVSAVGAGVVSLTKQATSAYGEYEQLAGGIETLFGEAAPKVMQDASNAFSDAGMSINKYMETSIQSAAALINSLEGDQSKAADLMNMSIIDMADNVNKMGTTMEAVQNAYRGFSRSNFTMLDNLALGFSGTKEGMQELLDKAKEISGIEYDISSYADIVQAIHVVQQEMGISGTTMKEAGSTITGSLGAVKAAWENLITGIANENANIGDLFDKLITSIFGQNGQGGFLSNILPRIEQALKGIVEFVKVGAERLPEVALEILPNLIGSFTEVINEIMTNLSSKSDEIIDNLGQLLEIIIENALNLLSSVIGALPIVFQIALKLVTSLANGLAQAIPELIPTIIDILLSIVDILLDNLDVILDAAGGIIQALIEGIMQSLPELSIAITKIVYGMSATLVSLLPQLITILAEIVYTLIGSLAKALAEMSTPEFWAESIGAIVNAFTKIDWAGIGMDCLERIAKGFGDGVSTLYNAVMDIIDNISLMFVQGTNANEWLPSFIDEVVRGFEYVVDRVREFAENVTTAIVEFFKPAVLTVISIWNEVYETFKPLIEAFAYLFETIFGAIHVITERVMNAIKDVITAYWNAIVAFWTPVIQFLRDNIEVAFEFIKEKIITPLQEVWEKIVEVWDNVVAKITEVTEAVKTIVSEAFERLKTTISEKLNPVLETVTEIWDGIKNKITEVVSNALDWGKDLINNFVTGIKDGIPKIAESVTGVADKIHEVLHFSEPDAGPLADFSTYAPDMMETFARGVADNENLVIDQIKKSFDFGDLITQSGKMQLSPAMAGGGGTGSGMTINLWMDSNIVQTWVVDALDEVNHISGGR